LWQSFAMQTSIDAAGRIVVPKQLLLVPGQVLEIRANDGPLVVEVAPTAMTLKKRGKGAVAVPETDLPPADLVRETLERLRR